MKCTPVVINNLNSKVELLERIESKPNDEKTEEWLQDVIFKNHIVLPVNEFDESFYPLIPLGREVITPRGNIDILFVSPYGKLTLVETKLWKNPEKHRTVVAQLIDYAKEVSKWTYDELSDAVLKSSRSLGKSEKRNVEQATKIHAENAGLDFSDFQDRLIKNMEKGEFLLLIVGDKISPNVALLSEAIHGAPGLNFTIGLIELQLHKLDENKEWPLIVIPDIVGRTVEEIRGVVQVEYQKEKPKIDVKAGKKKPKSRITQQIFMQKVIDDLTSIYEHWLESWKTQKRTIVYWGVSGFSYRVEVKGKLETILEAYPEWAVSLIREVDIDRIGTVDIQYQKYLSDLNSVPVALDLLGSNKKYLKHNSISAEDLEVILKATNEFAENIKDRD